MKWWAIYSGNSTWISPALCHCCKMQMKIALPLSCFQGQGLDKGLGVSYPYSFLVFPWNIPRLCSELYFPWTVVSALFWICVKSPSICKWLFIQKTVSRSGSRVCLHFCIKKFAWILFSSLNSVLILYSERLWLSPDITQYNFKVTGWCTEKQNNIWLW